MFFYFFAENKQVFKRIIYFLSIQFNYISFTEKNNKNVDSNFYYNINNKYQFNLNIFISILETINCLKCMNVFT